jgi:hypothetical protein
MKPPSQPSQRTAHELPRGSHVMPLLFFAASRLYLITFLLLWRNLFFEKATQRMSRISRRARHDDATTAVSVMDNDPLLDALADPLLMFTKSKRQRREDAELPVEGGLEHSGVACPWCCQGELYIWSRASLSQGPPPSSKVGSVLCSNGQTCVSSLRRGVLAKSLRLDGMTVEFVHYKVSQSIQNHLAECPSRLSSADAITTCRRDDEMCDEMGAADKQVAPRDVSTREGSSHALEVTTRAVGDPSTMLSRVVLSDPPGEVAIGDPCGGDAHSGPLFYFLRCTLCGTEDFIA